MLDNYTFQRYKDVFTLSNSDTGLALSYSLVQQINCSTSTKVVSSGTLVVSPSSSVINIYFDGDYQLILTRVGGATTTLQIRNYLTLQRGLIYNLREVICGRASCADCIKQGLDDCVEYQGVFGQIIGYQYLIKPYSPDYCLEGNLVDAFIHQAIELNKCVIGQELNMQLYNEAMLSKITSSKKLVEYLATIYYLVFYFYEKLLAVDDTERAYVDAKYYWTQVQFCISKSGINIAQLQALFTSLTGNNNQSPTVGNVSKNFIFHSGLQTYTFSAADFTNNFSDPNGDNPGDVMLLNDTFSGQLYYNGSPIGGQGFIFNIANAGLLQYKYTPTESNRIFDIIYFQISDDNVTPKYSNMATFNISVTAYVNQPPSAVGNNSISIGNRVDRVFTLADFTTATTPPYADPESDGVYQLRVDSLPSIGILKLSGTPVTSGQIIAASDIVAGNFVYDAPNQDAAATVTFNFSLSDTGSHTFTS